MPVKYKLDNGMTVLLVESQKSPVVSAQLWVKTGSVNELKGEEGLSHFIEHLVFKGSEKFGVGGISQMVESNGGELNAYTSFDQTVFYINISSQFTDVALDCLSQMMGFPTFVKEEIDNEREVVIEEIKRSADSPQRRSGQIFFSNVLKNTPYARPVIGYDRIIKKVSRKKIVDYFDSYYVPKNMTLIIAGDFETTPLKKMVKEHFSTFKVRKGRRAPAIKAPLKKANFKVEKSEFQENFFHLTWNIPGVIHQDLPALDALSMILGQGDSSRLVKSLRLEKALTNSIGAYTYSPQHLGVFDISFSLNLENLEETLAILATEIEKILTEPVSQDELTRAKIQYESDTVYGMETVEGLARRYGTVEFYFNDYRKYWDYMKKIMSLTPHDLLKAAQKYLKPEFINVSSMISKDQKKIEAQLKSFTKALRAKKMKTKPILALSKKKVSLKVVQPKSKSGSKREIEEIALPGGARLLFLQNQNVPLFSLKLATKGGIRVEDIGGTQEMFSRVVTSKTKNKDEAEIQEIIESQAASLSAYSGRNTSGLSVFGMTKGAEELTELFTEILTEHVIDETYLEREKEVLLESFKLKLDKPGYLVSQQFNHAFFKSHPYAKDPSGTPESVRSLKVSDLNNVWSKVGKSNNCTFACVGDIDKEMLVEKLGQAMSKLGKGEVKEPSFKFTAPKETEKLYTELKKEQTHVLVGYPGLTITDPRRYDLQVMQAILAGQGGRLFMELRDKASLAYSVSPMNFEGIEAGYFGAYIACSPEKTKKALEMMDDEFSKLVNIAVPQAEIDRAKRYLIGRHDLELQRMGAISTTILFQEVYGLPAKEMFQYHKNLEKVSSATIQQLAKDIFSKPCIMSVVGSSNPFKAK